MSIEFKDLPPSYRLSQGGIALALALAIFARAAFSQNTPLVVKIVAGSILGLIVLASLTLSCYVVIRYPYLSLVPTSDEDHFAKHFSLSGTWLYKTLKVLALAATAIMIVAIITGGVDNVGKLITLIYLAIMLGFLIFLSFIYDPVSHPTMATFIRATMGIGVLLFPLFIPALAIGSLRCRWLLEDIGDPSGADQ